MSELNDQELFKAAISDEPVTEAPVETPAEETPQEQPRADHGRFAAKSEPEPEPTPQPAPQEPAKEPTEAMVPSWRLREINEAREANERRWQNERDDLMRQMAELRQQVKPQTQEPVDWFTDPNAALKQQLSPIEQQYQSLEKRLLMRASRAEALSEYGKDAVKEMESAIEKAYQERHPDMQLLAAQMQASEHPIGVAMQWHQRDKLVRDTGGDLNAFKQRILDDAMKDPAFQAKVVEMVRGGQGNPQGKPNTLVQLPPSISRAPSAASPHEQSGDLSDGSLFRHAMS
jgi:hypothetical protein